MLSTGSAEGSWSLWLWFGCCCSCSLLFLWRALNNWWECDISLAQRPWAASPCRVTPLCASERSADLHSAQSWFYIKPFLLGCPSAQGCHCSLHSLQPSACPRALLELGMCRQAVKCVVFSSRSSVRHFLMSLENKKQFGLERTLTDHLLQPAQEYLLVPQQSLWSLSARRVTLPLSWCPRIHPPSAFWCDPATSLCLLVQYGQWFNNSSICRNSH